MIVEEHDVVLLKDGREGTVVYVGKDPLGYLVEFPEDEGEVEEISPDQIERVTWRIKEQ
ncbi:hypothetical protein SAMN02745885_01647 [Carboxydocella sporoproducens DSM 16521]|uniref:DUF4926 domain-containing protein n=2 Tax=Carboxydocella TaxID=178898 RepID=A0A1T4QEV8_9FIRM|nr:MULTISPECIES: DUF4926 domain-containing protein [Carboxydocella]AVX21604.1 hypothetical protein CFE_2461 [Carboxydocella thermautotrophica]AVX31810.1 hypothetical protein CTH_2267 [Carboxydocella thermautotrophica]SKA02340.1 hypothetical protein SAMN02745885_01647 [Carboxydocella sporoproducens DSM 16521]